MRRSVPSEQGGLHSPFPSLFFLFFLCGARRRYPGYSRGRVQGIKKTLFLLFPSPPFLLPLWSRMRGTNAGRWRPTHPYANSRPLFPPPFSLFPFPPVPTVSSTDRRSGMHSPESLFLLSLHPFPFFPLAPTRALFPTPVVDRAIE